MVGSLPRDEGWEDCNALQFKGPRKKVLIMSILGSLFGDNSQDSSDFLGFLRSTGTVDVNYDNSSSNTNYDGDTASSENHQHLGTDFGLTDLLGSMTDNSSDSNSGGGLLGIL